MNELHIKYQYYEDKKKSICNIFNLNKLNFNWRELSKSQELSLLFEKNKFLKHTKTEKYLKPTILINREHSLDEVIFEDSKIQRLAICLPCFDEEWSEISGTLRSISKNLLIHHQRPNTPFKIHVTIYIIQDGWEHASFSFKENITKEFNCPPTKFIDKQIRENCVSIFIPSCEIYYPAYNTKIQQDGIIFHPIFITKIRNAQKFNSHSIFFSMCNVQNPNFVFLTDCGTVFNPDCLAILIDYLYKKHTTVLAVTAKQSVMTSHIRNEIREPPYWLQNRRTSFCTKFCKSIYNTITWWLSPASLQGFEFESSSLLNTSMFNIAGILPVLPGPCQLLYWEHFQKLDENNNNIIDYYLNHLSLNPSNSSLIKTNTLLAEDRIFSFAMVLRTNHLQTIWVNGTSFYYEPMMSWVKLISQRRRWINGTISTFLYYLFDARGIDDFCQSGLYKNRGIQALWFIQLYQSILQIFSATFFSIAVFEALLQLFKLYPILNTLIPIFSFSINLLGWIHKFHIQPDIYITGLYFGFYLSWILVSFCLGKKSKCFPKVIYNCIMECIYIFYAFINMLVACVIYFTIFSTSLQTTAPLLYILLFIWGMPFLLCMFLSIRSSFYYIIYSIPFFLNIIQYVSFIPIFAMCRLHDLSWGNRDSSTTIDYQTQIRFTWKTICLNLGIITINFCLTTGYITCVYFFGHNNYIFIPVFIILFSSIIIQILFTILYLLKLIAKNIFKKKKHNTTINTQRIQHII